MEDNTLSLQAVGALLHHFGELVIEGVRKSDMAYKATLEEGERADSLGPIDDLIRDDEIHGLDLLPQGAYGRESNDAAHANVSKRSNVGARGNLVRRILMVMSMARKERDRNTIVAADEDGRGGESPGSLGVDGSNGLKPFNLAQPRAANYGDMDGFYYAALRIR